ncbi:MAG: M23 family metallopeptidase [Candidatus Gracilibacteria bacterium]|jgi:murein DD-endopeptidase MepM/ murein hydrolase activator NlpD|nr:M23 family metallopeptidase [Candidatus Gracilibacteria bacterium]MDD5179225.1 M23 family metallopeptidase [Candidatus Gracilibacteria bacterium]
MHSFKVNFSARKARIEKLQLKQRLCPKIKLTLQTLVMGSIIIIAPLFNSGQTFTEIAGAGVTDGKMLAIDSPDFTLDSLNTTGDGFLIKNAGQNTVADRSELSDPIAYTIEAGDNLYDISHRFGVSAETIIWENNISNPASLKPGTELKILPVSGITHTVQKGDTLAKLAKKYGVDEAVLAKQNKIENGELVADAKIIIPGGKKIVAAPVARYIASASGKGSYTSYTAPKSIDGAIISENGAGDKDGRWMIKPTSGNYTTYFKSGHWAVDIANRAKPAIMAAADGTVVKSQCGWNGGYGCVIVIDHGDGYQTLYGHMSKLVAGVGDAVTKGQQIGVMGNTGRVYGATGIHLHFEVIVNGKKKNPIAFY